MDRWLITKLSTTEKLYISLISSSEKKPKEESQQRQGKVTVLSLVVKKIGRKGDTRSTLTLPFHHRETHVFYLHLTFGDGTGCWGKYKVPYPMSLSSLSLPHITSEAEEGKGSRVRYLSFLPAPQ